jgi:hypothetical protein
MPTKDPAAPTFKQKAAREFKEYLWITLYLALLFTALTAYTMLLLRKHDVDGYLNEAFALVNALIIAKIILIGRMAHLGRRYETRPLYQVVLYKSFVYGLLVFVFHLVEDFVKRLIHGEPRGTVFHNIDLNDLASRTIVIFLAFIPLFAFMELGRIIGEEELHALFFHPRTANTHPPN